MSHNFPSRSWDVNFNVSFSSRFSRFCKSNYFFPPRNGEREFRISLSPLETGEGDSDFSFSSRNWRIVFKFLFIFSIELFCLSSHSGVGGSSRIHFWRNRYLHNRHAWKAKISPKIFLHKYICEICDKYEASWCFSFKFIDPYTIHCHPHLVLVLVLVLWNSQKSIFGQKSLFEVQKRFP